jgi:CubicO group peptidase (beta-lactamase class C family)
MCNFKRVTAGLLAWLAIGSTALAAPSTNPVALESFVDGLMAAQMDHYRVPGAVVSIVKDGEVLFAKGYGYADVTRRTRIDPATSLFRIASTTKLFTWTAVMQLVEQGKLDLDTDVNVYLKSVKVPATFPQPITLRHLMTHTAGFDRTGVGFEISTDLQHEKSIARTLAAHMPARIRPPGLLSSYSNYGAALAGLIVQDVSGVPYDDYVQKHIFDPLGMKFSTVREPLPQALTPYRVIGYGREGGVFAAPVIKTYEGGFRPAGSGSVSALDMARFMIAELPEPGARAILTPATVARMQAPAFTLDRRLPSMALGYYQETIAGEQVVGHGGSDPLFNTELYLVPARRLGVFVSYSGGQGDVAAAAFAKALLTRLYPKPVVEPRPMRIGSLGKYAGSYTFSLASQTKVDRFYSLMSQLTVSADGDRLRMGSGDEEVQFAPVGPNLFQAVGQDQQIAFRLDARGAATHLFMGSYPFIPLVRTPLLDRSGLWYPVVGGVILLFLSTLLGAAYRWRTIAALAVPERRTVWLSTVVAAWGLLSLGTVTVLLLTTDLVTRLSTIPISWRIGLLLPAVFIALTLALVGAVGLAWRRGLGRRSLRAYHTSVALAAVLLCLFFLHWNLVGWNFG